MTEHQSTDTTAKKVDARHPPKGETGEAHLASGNSVSMRLWRSEPGIADKPASRRDYDTDEAIDLAAIEPLVAKPSSSGNVVPVREVAGQDPYQAYIGSSANPGYRDFAVAAHMVRDRGEGPG